MTYRRYIPWTQPGDRLYRRSGVYSVRYLVELIMLLPETWMNPWSWYADGAEPGPWSWLQPDETVLSQVREKVSA